MTKKILATILALVLLSTGLTSVAFAAVTTDPYGHYYYDETQKQEIVTFSQYDKNDEAYYVVERTHYGGSMIWGDGFTRNDLKGTAYENIGYASDGALWYVNNKNELFRKARGSYTFELMLTGASYLKADRELTKGDDILKSVITTNGSSKLLKDLKPEVDQPSPGGPDKSKGNYVVMGTTTDRTKSFMEAYKNSKVEFTLYTRGANVWHHQANVLLSDEAMGLKFLGIDENYNVYLYEISGFIYKFVNGKWNVAVSSNSKYSGEVYCFNYDKYGFAYEVVTTTGTYKLKDIFNK